MPLVSNCDPDCPSLEALELATQAFKIFFPKSPPPPPKKPRIPKPPTPHVDTTPLDGPLAFRTTVLRVLLARCNNLPFLPHTILTFLFPFADPDSSGVLPDPLEPGPTLNFTPWNWILIREWQSYRNPPPQTPAAFPPPRTCQKSTNSASEIFPLPRNRWIRILVPPRLVPSWFPIPRLLTVPNGYSILSPGLSRSRQGT